MINRFGGEILRVTGGLRPKMGANGRLSAFPGGFVARTARQSAPDTAQHVTTDQTGRTATASEGIDVTMDATIGDLAEHLTAMRAPRWAAVRHDGPLKRYWAGNDLWVANAAMAKRYPDTEQLDEALEKAYRHQSVAHYEWAELGTE